MMILSKDSEMPYIYEYKAQQKAARTHTRDNTCRRVMMMLSKDSEMPYIYV